MTSDAVEVERALLALDTHERAAVIHRVLSSLDDERDAGADQVRVDAAWRAELRRRVDGVESGQVQLLEVDESHAQLRDELAARRV
ncbi:addiction module protein [Aeromicrobium sp. YIM 150415]|uniref:addiction module protein n=1 Tax=Aeromicrobium sp. YIM 150415 TaxID=2803912 RepID=UPI001966C98F|nr:addiction module protein [Aeromicrobium sp. YIM 150415]MBM9464009.1 addiction module protein [Aeromicrobium sp. YIM 150415]